MSAPQARDLVRELDEGRTAALALLERPGRGAVSAVAVLSNQLSAFTVVIAPRLPRSGTYFDLTLVTADLHRALRDLESLLCGDASVSDADVHPAMQHVVDLARRAGALERRLLTDLQVELGEAAADALLSKLDRALHHGPTRPHPGSPRRGVLGGLSRRLNARRDRVMDVLDARTVPGAHPATVHVMTGRERRAAGADLIAPRPPEPSEHERTGGTA